MHPIKLLWGIRAFVYRIYLGNIDIPSYIGKPCFIEGGRHIRIGKRVRIFPGIRLEAIGKGTINIGDNTAIEQNVHITAMEGNIRIGNDTTILANCFITNIDHSYIDIEKSILDQDCIYRKTEIGDGCFIGAGSAIQAGTILGKHCVVGANSVVRGKFPDYSVIVGAPGKIVKQYNINSKQWERVKKDNE